LGRSKNRKKRPPRAAAGGAQRTGRGINELLNAGGTGFVEPRIQEAYQRYLAQAGDQPLR